MLNWLTKTFNDLTNTEVYEILRLRQLVFIDEQHCTYLDADRKDYKSYHLLGYKNENIVAYSRLIPAGISYSEVSIGRIVVHPDARGGTGMELMQQAINECKRLFGNGPIRIGAQKWLKNFYMKSGFEDVGQPYYEDGVPHIIMLKKN
jgi:ElaA protein